MGSKAIETLAELEAAMEQAQGYESLEVMVEVLRELEAKNFKEGQEYGQG